ncbi:MAG: Fpg/Nei family DNA glycosylase [Chloroflexi bacterium]|nr:Fpg/Nei family DNA glycosylase [Chloroflexota bacterium]
MPEAPDLQVILEFLEPRLTGRVVTGAREVKPLVLRNLTGKPFGDDIAGRTVEKIRRHGKLLFFDLSDDRLLLINPMLTGGLRYTDPSEKILATTHVIIDFEGDRQLRYFDQKKMGMVYYLRPEQVNDTPRVDEQGPDVLDEPMSLEDFRTALRPFRGEIKGILTRGRLVSGVGNAYADEILHAAMIFPYKKRTRLTDEEVERLHEATYDVPRSALKVLRNEIGDAIHKKVRSFLAVHRKGGQSCPRCGYTISAITANKRETNFCRKCQPGILVNN